MPTPLVIDLQMYLASNEARAALRRAQTNEELLRSIETPADVARLLRWPDIADEVRDTILRAVLAERDPRAARLAAAVLILALRPSLHLVMRGVEAAHGDADSELAVAVYECLPAVGQPVPPYAEFRKDVGAKLSERRHGGSCEEAKEDLDMEASSEFGLPRADPIYFRRAWQILKTLKPLELQLVLGYAVLDESHVELAERVGISVNAARLRHSRAVRRVARQLATATDSKASINESRRTQRRRSFLSQAASASKGSVRDGQVESDP